MKRITLLIILAAALALAVRAAAPSGYYDAAKGKSGQSLLTALYNIIKSPHVTSYDGLFSAYLKTDLDADGYIIDMYSNYRFKPSQHTGSYRKIGDMYNREHSFPQSWFSKASPMKSDVFHVIPTDGYVNNQRSNYPFAECANGTRLTQGSYYGRGKVGTCTTAGYSGKVWEPDDEFKGDFARIYFYMATCYNNRIGSWSGNGTASAILAGNSYPVYKTWYINMLLRWSREDPVSDREKQRNDAAYGVQGNRNPYVDYPGLEEYVWGTKVGTAWTGDGTVTPTPLSTPVASAATSVTANGFTANWQAVSGATSYTLQITSRDTVVTPQPDPDPSNKPMLLLNEDMSGGTTTWTTSGKTFKDDGSLRLGSSSGTGSVTSPAIDLTASQGKATVLVTAQYYHNDASAQIKVSLVDASGNELASKTLGGFTASATTSSAVLTGKAGAVNLVKIENVEKGKRVCLSRMQVYSGDATALQAPRRAAVEAGDSTARTITGITTTSYAVTGLKRGRVYTCKVQAVNASARSDWSNAVNVFLPGAAATLGDVNGDGRINTTDVATLVDEILGNDPQEFVPENADIDGDGTYNSADITGVVALILAS